MPSVFGSRAFRQYFLGQSLSLLGDGLRTLANPLFAYHLTHSALSTGASLACEVGPFSLFGLVGGSLADRLDRRKLMIACDFIRSAVMTGFAVAYALHALTMPMIYSGLVVISVAAAAFLSAQSSSIPYLVRLVVLGGMLPGVFLFGWIADHRSAHLAMSIMVVGFVALAVVALCTPAVRNETR